MTQSKLIPFIVSIILLAGCGLGQSPVKLNNYVIATSLDGQTYSKVGDSLRIDQVTSTAPFNEKEMVYRVSDVKFESDYYNRFISEPEEIVGNQIALWLEKSGLYGAVSQPNMRAPSKQILQVSITKLFGDFRDNQQPAAVMEMQFVLVESQGLRPEVIMKKTLASRVNIDAKDPTLLAQGYGTALNDILKQLAKELSEK